MEEILIGVAIAFIGGALFRWIRHSAWRVSGFAIVYVVFAGKLLALSPRHPEEAWLGIGLILLLSLLGSFVIGLIQRSRIVRAAKGGAILLSKNVDALAEVAQQHDDSKARK